MNAPSNTTSKNDMQKNISFAYKEFVGRAIDGGIRIAATLEQAKIITKEAYDPLVVKLLEQYDGNYREAFLIFAIEAEEKGIWVIRGEATFLEPYRSKK